MVEIVEPKKHISALWGKQKISDGETLRLMRYVMRVDYEDRVLLYNVVTGQLVILNPEEAEAIEKLPAPYSLALDQLATEHFVVPDRYDEHQLVSSLRTILRKLDDTHKPNGITHYTILPTTACNARCYYCFEQGIKHATMTEKVADDVVEFISNHRDRNRNVHLSWFGGEPTVAANRVSQICKGLQKRGIPYFSDMTTNGYLFDENMVEQADLIWHLKRVMLCVDGSESNYNRIKAYVNAESSPYRRIMRNIGLLLNRGIQVSMRMNFDLNNYGDFHEVVEEAYARFGPNPLLDVFAHPVNGEYPNGEGRIIHATDSWFEEKLAEFNGYSKSLGLYGRNNDLPYLHYKGCQSSDDSYTVINVDGSLRRCSELLEEKESTGDIWKGIAERKLFEQWKEFADYEKCFGCVFYPLCIKMDRCPANDRCYSRSELAIFCKRDIIGKFKKFYSEVTESDFQRT